MAQQIDLIRENQNDGYDVVMTDRKGACCGCHAGGDGCRSCLSGAKLEGRVANPINAQEVDVVKITLKSSELFKSAALFYLLPVACLIATAFAGAWLAGWAAWHEITGSVLGVLVGLAVGISLVMLMGCSRYVGSRIGPSIMAVVTSAMGQPESKQPSCCS